MMQARREADEYSRQIGRLEELKGRFIIKAPKNGSAWFILVTGPAVERRKQALWYAHGTRVRSHASRPFFHVVKSIHQRS